MSPFPNQTLQCCFTFAYGNAGLTPPLSERKTCSRFVNMSLLTFGWNTVETENDDASLSYRNGAAPGVFNVSAIQNPASWLRGSSSAASEPFCHEYME